LKPARLNQQNLVKELKLRGIEASEKENKNILVSNLEVQLETVNEITNLVRIKHIKKYEKEDAKYTRVWAIGKYLIEQENNNNEMTQFVLTNIDERDLETQAVFEKNNFYSVGDKIMTILTSTHLTILNKDTTSNKCPLKVSLIRIPQKILREVKNNENAIIQSLITDYISEEYNFIKKYFNNIIFQTTSTPKNLIHSKLYTMHQSIIENSKEKQEDESLSSENLDKLYNKPESVSSNNSYSSKCVKLEDIDNEQSDNEFYGKKK
ncbi:27826_t:CDS:2, partial [Dentiscutata erythropus]